MYAYVNLSTTYWCIFRLIPFEPHRAYLFNYSPVCLCVTLCVEYVEYLSVEYVDFLCLQVCVFVKVYEYMSVCNSVIFFFVCLCLLSVSACVTNVEYCTNR